MAGISETQDVIEFVDELAAVIKSARADGSIDLLDAIKALTLAPSLVAAINGSSDITAELADLSAEEKDLLLADLKGAVFALIEAIA